MSVTIEEFNLIKENYEMLKKELTNYQSYFTNLSAGMTRIQTVHEKILKDLAEVKMELKKLKEPQTSIILKTYGHEKG